MRGQAHRRDANEKAIRAAVEALGWLWLPMSRDAAFDALLVAPDGRLELVETKNPKGKGLRLTSRESALHAALRARGRTIQVLTDTGASLDVLRRRGERNFYAREEPA